MRNITVTEESDDPTIGTHATSNRMSCELSDCENVRKGNIRKYQKRQKNVRMNNCPRMVEEETQIL